MAGRRAVPVVVVASSLLLGAAWAVGPYLFADRDHAESLDSPSVRRAALAACQELRADLESASATEDENRAVETMVTRIRAIGAEALADDVPAERWLDDWERLVTARRSGAGPDGAYPVPRADGVPITRRMDELVEDLRPCQVPEQLLPPRLP